MLNVYPQRATAPNDMHAIVDESIHRMNCERIQSLINTLDEVDICAAWGTEIGRRPYLIDCLNGVANAIGQSKQWFHLNALTKDGHPRHPLYLPADAEFNEFSIRDYIFNRS